jgi:REP element-mobilizing transposase RayT
MARAWRIEYEGALYHVLSRGNERRDIFLDDDDRTLFLTGLAEAGERFAVDVLAYVLMGNHYHLLLRTRRANLSKAMQWLGVSYTTRFNFKQSRSGHLFQGRFKSMLVQNDAYLLQLSYYIHRNPLRAGMVERLADYRWSSYPAYAYEKRAPEWLNTEVILSQLVNAGDRHRAYRINAQKYAEEEGRLWEDLRHGFILGSERFVKTIKERYLPDAPHPEVPQQKRLAKNVDVERVLSQAANLLGCDVEEFRRGGRVSPGRSLERDLLLYLIRQMGVLTDQQLGGMFGLGYSAVSRRAGVFKAKLLESSALQRKLAQLRSIIKT